MELFTVDQETFPMIEIGITAISLIVFFILRKIITRVVTRRALLKAFDPTRAIFINRTVKSGVTIIFIVVLGIIWDVSLEGLSIYMASFLTIVGVGLFATWSIVSNVTASVILFFFFPFRVGSRVKIVDGENSAEGEVLGLSLFSIRIRREDGNEVYYPNNLAIQKSIVDLSE